MKSQFIVNTCNYITYHIDFISLTKHKQKPIHDTVEFIRKWSKKVINPQFVQETYHSFNCINNWLVS